MRSGNGRHRRPRQAPALVVAAGVTGSALALPLLGAGSASAADAATWDRVAECESGGLWSADFGNGLYGGLQFTQETWETYGGTAYAARADLASRSQQIAVAEKALAAQGLLTWATCAPIAGLTNDGTAPEVDPGVAPTPTPIPVPILTAPVTPTAPVSPTAPVTPTAPAAPGTPAAPVESATPGRSVTPTEPVEATPGSGKHRGDPTQDETVNPDNSAETGRHASPADGSTSDASGNTDTTGVPGAADSTGTQGAEGEYTVQPGDSLSEIAQQNALPGGWAALYDANRLTVGADPDLILPGQSLDLAAETVPEQG